jgi:transcriptional regulator with XRE-family HTH domain
MASLRVLRERAGLTQTELADRTGLKQETISALECGKVPNPRKLTLDKLARGLGVPRPEVWRGLELTVARGGRRVA